MPLQLNAMPLSKQGWAKFAAVYAGLVFGIYWIPLRTLEGSGFIGLWSVALFNLTSLLLVLPFIVHSRRELIPGRARLHICTIVSGIAFVLYAGAFLYTEVVRVIALFYLMPIWGFLLSRIVTGEKITPIRWSCMALGLSGLIVICGIENGFPLPGNAGDWMALIAGILWAGASMMILTDKEDPVNYTTGFIFWSTIISVIAACIGTRYGVLAPPHWWEVENIFVWLIPFGIIVIIPAAFATLYGPSQLNPGTVGLLFMTEISIGTATAALFAGEPFGPKEIVGVILITLAGVSEAVFEKISTGKPA